jgi:hypothetical protein
LWCRYIAAAIKRTRTESGKQAQLYTKYVLTSIRFLFVQFARDEIAHRAFAKMEMPVRIGEGAILRILLEAFEDRLDAEILRPADIPESSTVAGKVLGALHPLHDLFYLAFVLSVHVLSGSLYLYPHERIEQISYQMDSV